LVCIINTNNVTVGCYSFSILTGTGDFILDLWHSVTDLKGVNSTLVKEKQQHELKHIS